MIIKYLVALYILIEITCDAQSSEGILILRDNNIDQTIRKNKYILVNFCKLFKDDLLSLQRLLIFFFSRFKTLRDMINLKSSRKNTSN